MTADAEAVVDRANGALSQIPTLTEALGCLDCERLFRQGQQCPYCASRALLNVADAISEERICARLNEAQRQMVYTALNGAEKEE